MKSGAEGGPFEISGTAEAGYGSTPVSIRGCMTISFTIPRRFVYFHRSVCCCLILCLLALLVKDGGFGVVKPKSNPSNRFDGVWVAFSGHIVRQASSWTAAGNFSLEAGAAIESG